MNFNADAETNKEFCKKIEKEHDVFTPTNIKNEQK